MNKRILYKTFEFEDRKWRIGKFDAMTGSYIAYKLMAEAVPFGLAAKLDIPVNKDAKTMSKTDFIDLQKDCLLVCSEFLPAGPIPVLNENGTFGVEGLENDAKTVLAFNVSDFFTESLLTSLVEAMQGIFRLDAKI